MAVKKISDEERFWAKVARGGLDQCWPWMAGTDKDGYALFKIGSRKDNSRRSVRGHRWIYEKTIGPIEDGKTIDHLCRLRRCMNTRHMEPVTSAVNTKRNARSTATHCKRGPPLSGDNLILRPSFPSRPWPQRACRECANAAARRHGRKTKWAACRRWAAKQKERLQSV